MVQKGFRFYILIFTALCISSCNAEETLKGVVNNEDSVHHYWDYKIGYKTYDSDQRTLRSGDIDPYGIKFFRVKLIGDEKYITFFMKGISKKSQIKDDVPVYLYMDNYLVDIDTIKNQKTEVSIVSPVEFSSKDGLLSIDSKKNADFYVVYFTKSGDDSLAFSIVIDDQVSEIDPMGIDFSKIINIADFIDKEEAHMGVLSSFKEFDMDSEYMVYGIAFIRNSFGEVVQYSSQPLAPFMYSRMK